MQKRRTVGKPRQCISGGAATEFGLSLLLPRDIEANGHVADNIAGARSLGHDRVVDPVQPAVLCAVADLAMPDLPAGDHPIHGAEEFAAMDARLEQAVIGSEQLLSRIAAQRSELVIDVSDRPCGVGDCDDCRPVEPSCRNAAVQDSSRRCDPAS